MRESLNRQIPEIQLSIVLPVFNESENLPKLYESLIEALSNTQIEYEVIFVDDGSSDESLKLLKQFCSQNERTVCIELTRNFGHQYALTAGMDYARGSACILMDADLQDDPKLIPLFLEEWNKGNQVVYAERTSRKEGQLKQLFYKLYYKILKKCADIDIPVDAGDFCLLDREALELIRNLPEKNRFLRGLRSWIGLKQSAISIDRNARYGGQPKYTLRKLLDLGVNGILSFSFLPLRFISMMGLAVSSFSILLAIFYLIKKFTYGLNPPGFATIVVLICFFAGIQLLTLGIIGEYIARIFTEVKNRPTYLVKNVIKSEK